MKKLRFPLGTFCRVIPLSRKLFELLPKKSLKVFMMKYSPENIGTDFAFDLQIYRGCRERKGESMLFSHPVTQQLLNKRITKTWVKLWLDGDTVKIQIIPPLGGIENAEGEIYEAPLGEQRDLSEEYLKVIVLSDETGETKSVEDWSFWGGKKPYLARGFKKRDGKHYEYCLLQMKDSRNETLRYKFESFEELLVAGDMMHGDFLQDIIVRAFAMRGNVFAQIQDKFPAFHVCFESEYQDFINQRDEIFAQK